MYIFMVTGCNRTRAIAAFCERLLHTHFVQKTTLYNFDAVFIHPGNYNEIYHFGVEAITSQCVAYLSTTEKMRDNMHQQGDNTYL
jgi:hypothetical protein